MDPNTPEPERDKAGEFKASDLRDAAGLSYRQLNDWDSKGALPGQRKGRAGWRRFSPREVFALLVCSELRKRFGAPVESLRFVRQFMLQGDADHLRAAAELMTLGLSVWLLTDLRETFILDSDMEFASLLSHGLCRGDKPNGFVFLNVNPLVNRILLARGSKLQLQVTEQLYGPLEAHRWRVRTHSDAELEVLELLREGSYKSVTVTLRDGEVVSAKAEREFVGPGRDLTDEEVAALIRSQAFQTVTLKRHDGRTVSVQQSVPIPMKRPQGGMPAKRATATPRRQADRSGRSRETKTK